MCSFGFCGPLCTASSQGKVLRVRKDHLPTSQWPLCSLTMVELLPSEQTLTLTAFMDPVAYRHLAESEVWGFSCYKSLSKIPPSILHWIRPHEHRWLLPSQHSWSLTFFSSCDAIQVSLWSLLPWPSLFSPCGVSPVSCSWFLSL